VTTEQLRLEIQVQVKEALKDLAATSGAVKGLAKEAREAVPPADQLKATMARLAAELKTSDAAAELFDDQVGGLRNRTALLKSAMVDLVGQGLSPASKEIQDLKREYDAASIASKELEGDSRIATGAFGDLRSSIASIGAVAALGAVTRIVGELGRKAIDTAGSYEMLRANFETLTGSAAAAREVFSGLKEFASVTPFNLEGVAKAGQQLMAAKVPVEELETRLGQLGDLSLGNGQKFESMSAAFSKMSTKGKVDMEQLNIFLEAGVPILDELASGFGVTSDKVFEMMASGKVSTADFVVAMERLTSKGGQFFGGMARGAETYEGVMSTMRDSIDGAAASFGELLLPAAKAVAGVVTGFFNAIAESPVAKGFFVAVITGITVALIAYGIAMAANTVKTWLAFAAKMGLNSAMAVGNPLLIAGIALAAAATVGIIAFAAAQNNAAESTNEAGSATAKASSGLSAAAAAARDYGNALDTMGNSELLAARASLLSVAATTASATARSDAERKLTMITAEMGERRRKAAADEAADLARRAASFKESWNDLYRSFQATSSSDPFAGVEYERSKKLGDAAGSGVNATSSKAVIDEINAYYDAKRREISDRIAGEERKRLAELTVTKVDDLEIQKAAELAAWKGSAEGRAAVMEDYDGRIAAARIDDVRRVEEETRKAATESFDLANRERSLWAEINDDKVEVLRVKAERELLLFEGTEAQKAALSARYEREIADLAIEEQKRVAREAAEARRAAFEASKASAADQGQWGVYAGMAAQESIKNTHVGRLVGAAGGAPVDPIMFLIDAFLEAAMSAKSVQDALNAVTVLFAAVFAILDPMLGDALMPIFDLLDVLAPILASVLMPFITNIAFALRLVGGILNVTLVPVLKLVGFAFAWLNDSVIVPFGNAIIKMVNAIITAINWLPNWMTGGDIALIKLLQTSTQISQAQAIATQKEKAVSDEMDRVKELFAERRKDLEDAYSKNVGSLKNLLELGAISEADYASRMSAANIAFKTDIASLDAAETSQLAILEDILEELRDGNIVSNDALHSAGVPGYAVGAVAIPQTQLALVHKGETVVPSSFADGLRRGELTLGKGNGGTVIQVNTTVHVAGSAVAMDTLADDLAVRISRRTKRGLAEVGF